MEKSKTTTVMQLAFSVRTSGFELKSFSPTQMAYKSESGSLMYLSQQIAARTVAFSVQNVNSHLDISFLFCL